MQISVSQLRLQWMVHTVAKKALSCLFSFFMSVTLKLQSVILLFKMCAITGLEHMNQVHITINALLILCKAHTYNLLFENSYISLSTLSVKVWELWAIIAVRRKSSRCNNWCHSKMNDLKYTQSGGKTGLENENSNVISETLQIWKAKLLYLLVEHWMPEVVPHSAHRGAVQDQFQIHLGIPPSLAGPGSMEGLQHNPVDSFWWDGCHCLLMPRWVSSTTCKVKMVKGHLFIFYCKMHQENNKKEKQNWLKAAIQVATGTLTCIAHNFSQQI